MLRKSGSEQAMMRFSVKLSSVRPNLSNLFRRAELTDVSLPGELMIRKNELASINVERGRTGEGGTQPQHQSSADLRVVLPRLSRLKHQVYRR
ncbi:hypothetical protein RRG08_045369 [Elysia crispata]|uniref:Uncharacterized protein n=1 Tax=Elysia crispata TaxID=231223 RepID=A0AAE1CVL9_9GAST|nr:hypothetical protein RRG08_045369 [Elysia crispata]